MQVGLPGKVCGAAGDNARPAEVLDERPDTGSLLRRQSPIALCMWRRGLRTAAQMQVGLPWVLCQGKRNTCQACGEVLKEQQGWQQTCTGALW